MKEDERDGVTQFRKILVENLGMESKSININVAFRLWKKQVGGTRPVLVKLEDMKSKSEIMNRCHLLKGSGIFINQDFTALQKTNMKVMVYSQDEESKRRGMQ